MVLSKKMEGDGLINTVKERAYAKVNLYLDIVGRRPDGFHDIRTVMQTVSLSDLLTVTAAPSRTPAVRLTVQGNSRLPTNLENLAAKAALAYMNYTGHSREIRIHLNKKIPVGAGLAGGSANAAAVLRAMNKLFDRMLSERVLLQLAATVGSDVPFCLLGGTALCEGRGERIARLSMERRLFFVIATAGEYVSTPTAYAALDRRYSFFDGSVPYGRPELCDALLQDIQAPDRPLLLYNVFEDVVLPTADGARAIKERLLTLGAASVCMSGSGPAVYGIFDSTAAAHAACDALTAQGYLAFYAESI